MAIRKGYIDTPEGQVHYRTAGEGRPLLLLHMTPSSSAMWEAVLPRFADRCYQALALDTPGFGNSDAPTEPPDMAYYARRIVDAAERFGWSRFDVFGHHTGATIGATIAALYPDRVGKLALWGYPMPDPESRARLANMPPKQYDWEGQELLHTWNSRRGMAGEHWTPALGVRSLMEALQSGPILHWGFRAVANTDAGELATKIPVPVLLMSGARDQIWTQSQAALQLIPNVRWAPIVDAGIFAPDEYPEEAVRLVDEFLRAD